MIFKFTLLTAFTNTSFFSADLMVCKASCWSNQNAWKSSASLPSTLFSQYAETKERELFLFWDRQDKEISGISSAEAYWRQLRWVSARNKRACFIIGRQAGPVIRLTTLFFGSWYSTSTSVTTLECVEANREQHSLTQFSTAMHHQLTFLEADASDTGNSSGPLRSYVLLWPDPPNRSVLRVSIYWRD